MDWWVKLAERYWVDGAVAALDDTAEVMFTRSIASDHARVHRGLIPSAALGELTRSRRPALVAERLVTAGLWEFAAGGYRIVNWLVWQAELDALERRRRSDRERQSRRRAQARASREASQSTTDSASRDVSRDVTVAEGEGDRELGVGVVAQVTGGDQHPPPRRCPRHTTHPDPPPCRACGDARRANDAWQRDHADPGARSPAYAPPPRPERPRPPAAVAHRGANLARAALNRQEATP